MKVYKAREFCETVRISKRTLDRLVKTGQINPIYKNGLRYFTDNHVQKWLGLEAEQRTSKLTIAYARVSSSGQRKDLQSQVEALEQFSLSSGTIVNRYIRDVGSGINFERKGLNEILELAFQGQIAKLIVTYKDRLCRFAFELLEAILRRHGCEVVVINLESTSPQEELVEDLMTVVHVFSSRLYGLRRYKTRKDLRHALLDEGQAAPI